MGAEYLGQWRIGLDDEKDRTGKGRATIREARLRQYPTD